MRTIQQSVRLNRFRSGRIAAFDLLLVVFAAAAIAGTATCVYVAIWLRPTQPAISSAVAMMAFVLALALVGIVWLGVRGRTIPVLLNASGVQLGQAESGLLIPWSDVDRVVVDRSGGKRLVPVEIQLTDIASVLEEPWVGRMFGGDGLALSRVGGIETDRLDLLADWAEHRLEVA